MKKLLTNDELIIHMKNKGIKFNITTEEQAKAFLETNNYYMKLASYRTNYLKSNSTQKYINLEFAYLQELSTIDMQLRYLIIKMCLDIEHSIKVLLVNSITKQTDEDGYELIRLFLNDKKGINILHKIKDHKNSQYCKNLIDKYYPYFPVWVFVELISFGDLTYLCDFYNNVYGVELIKNKFMNDVRDLRNAAAHSNCIINRLFDEINAIHLDSDLISFVKKVPGISSDARRKNMRYSFTNKFVTFLYVYDTLITSSGIRQHQYEELKELFNVRMVKNKSYFISNTKISGVYIFLKKIVDNLVQ